MINKLHLESFGRFSGHSFAFKPFTLFFGHNESGKTTIFDALFDVICNPKGTTEHGKLLNSRYTKERQARADFKGDILNIDEADFLNFFAIRCGEIDLKIESDSKWMNSVKASLFSGGLDPQDIAEELGKTIDSNAKGSFKKERAEISKELEMYIKEKEEAQILRTQCLQEEKRIERAESTMSQDKDEIFKLREKKEELEKTLEQQKMIFQKKDIEAKLEEITSLKNMNKEKDGYSYFSENTLNELRKKENECQELREEVVKITVSQETVLQDLQQKTEEKNKCEKEKNRGGEIKKISEELQKNLAFKKEKPGNKPNTLKILLITAAFLLFVGGIIGILLAPNRMIFFIFSLITAAFCAIVGLKLKLRTNKSQLELELKKTIEIWQKETGEMLELDYNNILTSLIRAAEKYSLINTQYEQITEKLSQLENHKQTLALEKQKIQNTEENLRQNYRKLLEEAGVRNIEEYSAKLAENRLFINNYNELAAKVKSYIGEYGVETVTQLESLLNSIKSELREKIAESELSQNEIKLKENLLRETKTRLDVLQNKDKENYGSVNLDKGTVRGKFKGLPEKIASCEKNILEREERLKNIEKEINAVRIAKELFVSLSKDSSLMFDKLSNKITEQFCAITSDNHSVKMNNFTFTDIQDAQGTARSKEHLSTGTRDSFVLAARLVLARESRRKENNEFEKAIVVMDEPFLALDKTRTSSALSVLDRFHKDTKWQIIIFTKDEETVKQAKAVFGENLGIHNLNPGI